MDETRKQALEAARQRVDVTKAAVLSVITSGKSLHLWWHNLGRTLVNLFMRTSALAFVTLLTAALTYLIVSRRLKDSYFSLAIWVFPEWLTAATSWIKMLSRLAQEYALLGSYSPAMYTGLDTVAGCLSDGKCTYEGLAPQLSPVYTGHGCVGTITQAANLLIQEAILCALVVFSILPSYSCGMIVKGLFAAPFVAACVSAVLNVKNVCTSGDIVLNNNMSVEHMWATFEPHGVDPLTAKLARVSHALTLLIFVIWIWKYRHGFVAHLNGSVDGGYAWIRPVLIIYAVPPVVLSGLDFIRRATDGGNPREVPIGLYVLFAAAYSFIHPIMGMWPGLVMIYHRLQMPDNILPITQVKEDLRVPPPTAVSQSTDGAADVKSHPVSSSVVATSAPLAEKS